MDVFLAFGGLDLKKSMGDAVVASARSRTNLASAPDICNDGNPQEAIQQAQQIQEDLAARHAGHWWFRLLETLIHKAKVKS